MKAITVKYGPDTITKSVEDSFTVNELKNSDSIRAALGFGDNTKVLVRGIEQHNDVNIPSGATLTVETACNQKA